MLMLTISLLSIQCCYITFAMDANAPLYLLDRRIFDELSEPTEIIGRGDLLLKETIAYYCNLYDIFNDLKFKNKEGMEMIRVLEKDGGPRLPMMEVNGDIIKTAYKWQDKDLEVLTTMLSSIKNLWRKVTDMVYQLDMSMEAHHSQISE